MKLGCIEIIYTPCTVRGKVKKVFMAKKDREAAYKEFRTLTGKDVKESHRVVKPWLKLWEGRKP